MLAKKSQHKLSVQLGDHRSVQNGYNEHSGERYVCCAAVIELHLRDDFTKTTHETYRLLVKELLLLFL